MTIRDDVGVLPGGQGGAAQEARRAARRPSRLDARHPTARVEGHRPKARSSTYSRPPDCKKPDITILSDQFLAEVRGLKHKNVAAELLQKLLKDEIKSRSKRNFVQSRSFRENAQEDAERLPQPRDRDAGGHRGTDRTGQGNETPRPSAASSSA